MKMILGEDIECPFCGKIFLRESEVEVTKSGDRYTIYCSGCGSNLEVEIHSDGKIYI